MTSFAAQQRLKLHNCPANVIAVCLVLVEFAVILVLEAASTGIDTFHLLEFGRSSSVFTYSMSQRIAYTILKQLCGWSETICPRANSSSITTSVIAGMGPKHDPTVASQETGSGLTRATTELSYLDEGRKGLRRHFLIVLRVL